MRHGLDGWIWRLMGIGGLLIGGDRLGGLIIDEFDLFMRNGGGKG